MPMSPPAPAQSPLGLARTIFAILAIVLLIGATIWVLYPFLPALIWAVMIVIATWRLMLRVQRRLWGSRACAVIFMTMALLLILVLPLSLALSTVVRNVDEIAEFARSTFAQGIPTPPSWLADVPLVGAKLVRRWQEVRTAGGDQIVEKIAPYLGQLLRWFVSQIGGVGMLFIHFLLTVILSAVLYANGEAAGRGVLRFARRLADDNGEHAVLLAAQAIYAVALGVVVTALIQSAMAALGLLLAGVPYPMILVLGVFLLSVIQIGAGPVLILATIWLYSNSSTSIATAFLIWSIIVMVADNFIRPLLIKAGADLPLLLIFAGVIGGLITFGVIGLFIGPVVLAVSYTLLKAWVEGDSKIAPSISN